MYVTTNRCMYMYSDGEAKFQVGDEIRLMVNKGMKPKDIKLAESIIEENKELIITEWVKIYGK